MSIHVEVDRTLIRRSSPSNRYLLVTVEAPHAARSETPKPAHVALVIDRSGSMQGLKLARAKDAAKHALRQLNSRDRFCIVTYDDAIDILVASTLATEDAKALAIARVDTVESRGGTDLSGGWLHGCQQLAEHLHEGATAKCLLLTDGLANRGIQDVGELEKHAAALRLRHIATSTFGIGEDFDEDLLQRLAQAGGGHFYFIDDAETIPRIINEDLRETLETVAREAVLEVQTESADVTSLNGFPAREAAHKTIIELGSLISGQVMEAIVKLRFPPGPLGSRVHVVVGARDRDEALDPQLVECVFEYARGNDNDVQPRNRRVDRRVAAVYAARAKREASNLNREGAHQETQQVIDQCRNQILRYAGDDEALLAVVADLGRARDFFAHAMSPKERKAAYFSSTSFMKSRSMYGSSRRRILERTIAVATVGEPVLPEVVNVIHEIGDIICALGGTVTAISSTPVGSDKPLKGAILTNTAELEFVAAIRLNHADYGALIALMPTPFQDGWFSHWHPSSQTAVVSLGAARQVPDVGEAAFIAYELLLHALHLTSPDYDLQALLHEEARGCLFDLCPEKYGLAEKLRSMRLCRSCTRVLADMSIDTALIEKACEAIHTLSSRSSARRHS